MPYSPFYTGGWKDFPDTTTPIVAAALQNMEAGISAGIALDATASDIQPLGAQAAGSTGKAADAGHVHPTSGVATIDGTAADIAGVGTRAAGAAGKAADAGHVHPFPEWKATDYGLLAWAFDPVVATTTSTAIPNAGKLFMSRLHLPQAGNLTNIVTSVTTAGSVLTSGQCFCAVWQAASGALLGQTADQSVNFAGTGNLVMAITGGPVAAAAGDLWVGAWFNGTTGPALARANNAPVTNIGLSGTASRFASAGGSITTTAPGLSGISPAMAALNTAYWFAVS